MAGNTPQRCSCRTAPRMSACVDIVSEPYWPFSRRITRAPARASNSAVAAPAQRAPTITASTLIIGPPLGHARTGQRTSDLLGDHACVIADAIDKAGIPPALEVHAEHVEPEFSGRATLMHDF